LNAGDVAGKRQVQGAEGCCEVYRCYDVRGSFGPSKLAKSAPLRLEHRLLALRRRSVLPTQSQHRDSLRTWNVLKMLPYWLAPWPITRTEDWVPLCCSGSNTGTKAFVDTFYVGHDQPYYTSGGRCCIWPLWLWIRGCNSASLPKRRHRCNRRYLDIPCSAAILRSKHFDPHPFACAYAKIQPIASPPLPHILARLTLHAIL
jgi:hypothetical protein